MNAKSTQTITLALTGGSGMPYAFRLLECLLQANHCIYLTISQAAQLVIALETDMQLPNQPAAVKEFLLSRYNASPDKLHVFGAQQWMAPIASGSAHVDAMVVAPASSGVVAAIANGNSDNLIERAADVMLKEHRKLIILHREMPLSEIHLKNLLTLARAGAIIMPANPGFYHNPKSIDDLVDFVVARVLDHLGVEHSLIQPWGEASTL